MRRPLVLVWLLLLTGTVQAGDAPSGLRCEWRVQPDEVRDPCPEFFWETESQTAHRVRVARSADDLAAGRALVWDSDRVETRLPIAEYAGPELANHTDYFWTVQVWDAAGRMLRDPPAQRFRLDVRSMPHHLPTIRTFINFAGEPDFAAKWLDLCFRREAKQGRPDILAVRYGLICTLVLPHPSTGKPLADKARSLADFCVKKGLTRGGILEDMFCHFAEDTWVVLHVGAELTSRPREKRLCPGWDASNDRNGDGRVDDAEFSRLANPKATAREPRQARIPIYYWGPPNDDFVVNVGHPAYQEFMAAEWAPHLCEGYDGIYFDTVPVDVAGAGRTMAVREYPAAERSRDRWRQDLQMLFARIKIALPDKMITGNGWDATPMVSDGRQDEGWQAIEHHSGRWRRQLDRAIELDRRGKVQLIQYNPIYDAELSEFGPKLPISRDRDKMFGLATYLLAHGRFTYFGFGRHPYANVTRLWFPAMRCDLGEPTGPYYLFTSSDPADDSTSKNLLVNGGFEESDSQGNPLGWQPAKPLEVDRAIRRSGTASARISSPDRKINNINRVFVRLKPHTSYTLVAWVKTDHVDGQPGAQVYPYEFDGVQSLGMLTWTGTQDWTQQRLAFTTADDAEGRVNFRIFGASGSAWFDDIRLVEGVALKQQVFARRYTKGLVLVKPYVGGSFGDDTALTYKLAATYRPLQVDGTWGEPRGEILLRNGEAAVLLAAESVGPTGSVPARARLAPADEAALPSVTPDNAGVRPSR